MIRKIEITNFTCFENISIVLVPGVNVFIGENGTGKTHLLKLLYAIQSSSVNDSFAKEISGKILRIFLPRGLRLKRLIRKGKGPANEAEFSVSVNGDKILGKIRQNSINMTGSGMSCLKPAHAVYIPVKEMLVNAPGFRSLYSTREIHFEEIYHDIIDKAFLPPLKNIDSEKQQLLKQLEKKMGGKVISKNEVFFLKSRNNELEFTLIPDGTRKLALLWLLIRNGSIDKGSTLYWDEPEANLNPSMMPTIVETLLQLEKTGVQIVLTTHSYAVLKEFELQREDHSLRFSALFKENGGGIQLKQSNSYTNLFPNKIAEEFARIYDLEIKRAIRGK